jgi:hypothetical protein
MWTRVARWFVFKPKIPLWKKFQGLILEYVGTFYAIWNILWTFGIFL